MSNAIATASTDIVHSSTQLKSPSMLELISTAATDKSVDASKMRELWALAKEMEDRSAEKSFWSDFYKACCEMEPVVRDAEVKNRSEQVTNRYARLETIHKAISPIYKQYGFALSFSGGVTNTEITCRLIHRDGHVEKHTLNSDVLDASNAAKSAIQAFGSTLKYLQRYLTCLIFNIQFKDEDDDDGISARQVISPEQVSQILDMFAACELPKGAESYFLQNFMKVKTVEEIPSRDFSKAMEQLKERYRQVEAKRRG